VQEKRRRTISDGTLAHRDDSGANDSIDALPSTSRAAQGKADAFSTNRLNKVLNSPRSARIAKKLPSSPATAHLTRRATRLSGASAENLATKLSALSKRGKKAVEKGLGRLSRELRRLQDTNEYAHIDTRPVRYTVWSNGKYVDVDPSQEVPAPERPRKKVKVDENATNNDETKPGEDKQEAGAPAAKKPRVKKWLEKGLYAGQEAPLDIFKGLTSHEKKKLASIPELMPSGKPNRVLPQPMYNGLRILINGRDFKLPFDVCHPLPPGQPKPAAYRTMTKSEFPSKYMRPLTYANPLQDRFVGNAASYWKKTPHFEDFASKCVCKPEDGCGEDCQNRIMLYECDETNCNVGKAHCTNRSFQDLQERTKKGGRYRVGVEVFKTPDRGYGVRSNRCFEPNQIIMEYTGEIITVEECERRMNEEYKDNEVCRAPYFSYYVACVY
jgi:histone-lysine N-methyltransferase ASH1L